MTWEAVWEKIVITVVGMLVTALVTWLGTQIAKYKKLNKKEEDAIIKTTIVNTLSEALGPIKTDITNMKKDIGKLQKVDTNFTTRLKPVQEEIEHLKDDITEILNTLKEQGVDLDNIREKEKCLEHETRCAWRYRIRTLCHNYLRRGWMTHDEFEQLQEMFNLYTAIGGNGQTKELYERTMQLDILTDAEAAELDA